MHLTPKENSLWPRIWPRSMKKSFLPKIAEWQKFYRILSEIKTRIPIDSFDK